MLFSNIGNGPKNCVKAGALGVCVTAGVSISILQKKGNRTVKVTYKK